MNFVHFRFVVLVSTYFLCGCTFKFCYGFRGEELLPHSQFWIDLPVLIVVSVFKIIYREL